MISTDITMGQGPDNPCVTDADFEEQGIEKAGDRRKSRFLIQLPPELLEAVERSAFANARPRNSEIVLRLRRSFEREGLAGRAGALQAMESAPAIAGWLASSAAELTVEEQRLLSRFKTLSAEQQAALLTLLG